MALPHPIVVALSGGIAARRTQAVQSELKKREGDRSRFAITGHYRTLDPTVATFGLGGRHQYEVFVRAVTSDLVQLRTPKHRRPWLARQPDGTYVNRTLPELRGAMAPHLFP